MESSQCKYIEASQFSITPRYIIHQSHPPERTYEKRTANILSIFLHFQNDLDIFPVA